MALKYFTEYRSLQTNSLWRIEIDSPTYTDEPIELIPGENPLIMEWQGNNEDDPFKAHVINSTCQIQVFNDGLDLDELMLINDASYKCRVYREGILDWQGFVISDGIRDIDSGVPYVVTLKAIDGLELLDNVAFAWTQNYGAISVGGELSARRCPMNAIRLALYSSSNLDNQLPIRWSVSLRNLNYPLSDALAGLTEINNDGKLSLLTEKSAFWWLKNICQSVGCWIVQQHGFWYIYSYADLVDNDGILDFWQIETTSTSTEIATSVTLDLNVDGNDFVNENASWWVKKPIGGVKVTYQNTTDDGNVVPNGNFDLWSTGALVDWGFLPSPFATPFYTQFDSLYEREGSSVQLTNPDHFAQLNTAFTYSGTIPLDSKLLFKHFNFGFTFMPSQYGFPTDINETIIWDSNPLRVSVSFTARGRTWYLNEFGFWQFEGRGLGLGTTYVRMDNQVVATNVETYWAVFEGSPNIGDVLAVSIRNTPNGSYNEYTFTVTAAEEGQLGLALDGLLANIPNTINGRTITNKLVIIDSDTSGRIRFTDLINFRYPTGRTYKSGATQEYRYLYMTIDGLKINDVANIAFSGKGGNSEILLPEIDNIQPGEEGKLNIEFTVRNGQQYVLDDVYLRVPQNNDVYLIESPSSKNSKTEYTMEISSSFSGHLLSSYMNNYSNADESMLWTGGKTLTQIYGETIINWYNKPCRVFEGDVDVVRDWGLWSIRGVNYVPLSVRFDARDEISSVTAIEIRQDVQPYNVRHVSSDDKILEDWGGS